MSLASFLSLLILSCLSPRSPHYYFSLYFLMFLFFVFYLYYLIVRMRFDELYLDLLPLLFSSSKHDKRFLVDGLTICLATKRSISNYQSFFSVYSFFLWSWRLLGGDDEGRWCLSLSRPLPQFLPEEAEQKWKKKGKDLNCHGLCAMSEERRTTSENVERGERWRGKREREKGRESENDVHWDRERETDIERKKKERGKETYWRSGCCDLRFVLSRDFS